MFEDSKKQFADEEVQSESGYPSGYKPRSLGEQITRLHEVFQGLALGVATTQRELPAGAEGWFAIPRWEKIESDYGAAVQRLFDLISKTRGGKFHNYREGKLGPNRLRQHERTVTMLEKLGDQQKEHDILIVPAQFGLLHRGRSVRRTREVFAANEFGLGAFAVGIMLLTHLERLKHYKDLWIDCAGEEYDCHHDDEPFSNAPFFVFSEGNVEFGARWLADADSSYGSASGFVP